MVNFVGVGLVVPVLFSFGCENRSEFAVGTRLNFRFDASESEFASDELRSKLVSLVKKRLGLAQVSQFRVHSGKENIVSVDLPKTVSDLGKISDIVTTRGRIAFHVVSKSNLPYAEFGRCLNEERAYQDALEKWRDRLRDWRLKKVEESEFSESRPPRPSPQLRIVRTDVHGNRRLLENTTVGHVAGDIVEDASIVTSKIRGRQLLLKLTEDAGARLGEMTEANLGRQVAIVLDGKIVAVPEIHSRIDREALIKAQSIVDEIENLVVVLKSGPLLISLERVSE